MIADQLTNSPFFKFSRNEWSELGLNTPFHFTENDLSPLLGFNEILSIDEVRRIYLPIARLINYYIDENLKRQKVLQKFLQQERKPTPYIISIAGSVSVGKSTFARVLQALLQNNKKRKVDLVTTDGFLYPLEILKKKNLLDKKGFPQSYDSKALLNFVLDVKSGNKTRSPLYSHITYDILEDTYQEVDCPDILILEGLNVLQTKEQGGNLFISDIVDFSIYLDADETLLKQWYIERFLSFCNGAFADPLSYFHHFSHLTKNEAIDTASNIWDSINSPNLNQHILPTRERADLILKKKQNHLIERIYLKK